MSDRTSDLLSIPYTVLQCGGDSESESRNGVVSCLADVQGIETVVTLGQQHDTGDRIALHVMKSENTLVIISNVCDMETQEKQRVGSS